MVSFYDAKFRGYAYQIIAAIALFVLLLTIFQNTLHSIQSRGITTGFGFLKDPANFSIIQTLIPYNISNSYGRVFFVGLLNTILIAVIGVILATFLGFIVGIMRLSKNFLIAKIAAIYVELFRNIPLLLQIFFWYHAVLKPLPNPQSLYQKGELVAFGINNRGLYFPSLVPETGFNFFFWSIVIALVIIVGLKIYTKRLKENTGREFPLFTTSIAVFFGLPILVLAISFLAVGMLPFSFSYSQMQTYELSGGFKIIPEFISLLLALVIYTASFIAENVRSGLQAVDYGQTESAYALGCSRAQTTRLILIPQALKVIIPPLINQYLNLTKNSSLAAAVAYPEIVSVFAGTALNQTGQALEILGITMGIYLLLSILTSLFLNWYNQKILIKER